MAFWTLVVCLIGALESHAQFSKFTANKFCSPRHLTVHGGHLYVAEAGVGRTPLPDAPAALGAPCMFAPHQNAFSCWGNTSLVSRLPLAGGQKEEVLKNLFSARAINGSGESHVIGAASVAFDANGTMYTVMGLGANGTVINQSGFDGGNILSTTWGQAQTVLTGISSTVFARPWVYEFANNPDGKMDPSGLFAVPDSNPYHALVHAGFMYVIDAGGNDLLTYNMTTRNVVHAYVFPENTGLPALSGGPCVNVTPTMGPYFCGQYELSNTWFYSSEAVPVAVRRRPGFSDKIYVAELSGAMWTKAVADILEITLHGGIPQSHTSLTGGFWSIVDFEFQGSDTMYVLEGNPGPFPWIPFSGRLTRVNLGDATHEILAEQELQSPSGLAIHNDILFISNASYDSNMPCMGEIIAFSLLTTSTTSITSTTVPTHYIAPDPTNLVLPLTVSSTVVWFTSMLAGLF